MNRKFLPVTILLAGVITLASCLSDDDGSSDITYYGDAAITAFSLGTLNQTYLYNNGDTIKQTTDGADSTTTVDCSSYAMTIDHKKGEIYNTDSLPAGVDISKVVCSVSSKNSGVITVKRESSDTLDYYSSSDSLNFATTDSTRLFYVFSTDGTARREYKVKLNVHREQPDSFVWHCQSLPAVENGKQITGARIYSLNNRILTFESDGTNTYILASDNNNSSSSWTYVNIATSTNLGADAYKNTAVLGEWLYLLDGNKIIKTKDGENWTDCDAAPSGMKRLVGASKKKLYALTDTGIASSTDGITWNSETLDAPIAQLPSNNIAINALPLTTNSGFYRVIMTGNSSTGSKYATVWGKLESSDDSDNSYQWSLYEGENSQMLPDMQGLSTAVYDGSLLAIGGAGLNGNTASAYNKIYCSNDKGLSWQKSTSLTLPSEFDTTAQADAIDMTVDTSNNIWIVSAATRQVWKTRINRLGWKTTK